MCICLFVFLFSLCMSSSERSSGQPFPFFSIVRTKVNVAKMATQQNAIAQT
jgi:hypothetical protein